MAAAIRLLGELSRTLERPMLERQLQSRPHVRLELPEPRKGLGEHLLQPRPAVDLA